MPPELAAAQVTVSRVLGGDVVDIVTSSQITVARHRLAPDGAGAIVRDHGHVVALEQAAMATASAGGRPHRRKERIPPGPDALAAAEALRRGVVEIAKAGETSTPASTSTVTDLAAYERAARGRNTLA